MYCTSSCIEKRLLTRQAFYILLLTYVYEDNKSEMYLVGSSFSKYFIKVNFMPHLPKYAHAPPPPPSIYYIDKMTLALFS